MNTSPCDEGLSCGYLIKEVHSITLADLIKIRRCLSSSILFSSWHEFSKACNLRAGT